MSLTCTYCGQPATLVSGDVIYPHRPDLADLRFWNCAPCGAFVGCHKNSRDHKPLGTLANAETREWRKRAHSVFDPLWKSGRMSRRAAYDWLAEALGYEKGRCHISWMTAHECSRVVEIMKAAAA